jgi:AcrR family transcriptional regulator
MRAERIEVRESRERILAAAERHYSVQDSDPTMAQLARLAGVGTATLYRRYPQISDVVSELYNQLVAHFEPVALRVQAQDSAWGGVVALVDGIVATLQEHPAIPRLNRRMVALDDDHRFTSAWAPRLDELIAAAQREGSLRSDVNAHDLTFAAFRLGSYSNLPPSERDRILGRQMVVILDGLRADGLRTPMPSTAISHDDLHGIFRYEVQNPLRTDSEANPVDRADARVDRASETSP